MYIVSFAVLPQINTLFYLLADTVLNVVGSQETPVKVPKHGIGQMIRNRLQKLSSTAGSILPIDT